MTSDNRFQPPRAALDPSTSPQPRSRGPVAALAVAGLLQLAWLGAWAPRYLQLVSEGVMNPVGPFVCVLGCVCLYAGLLRALSGGVRGRNLFIAAVVLLLAGLALLGAHRVIYALLALMPFVVAVIVATLGVALTWRPARPDPA